MATSVQTLPLTRDPSERLRDPRPAPPPSSRHGMGSVGSLVERPDVSAPQAKGGRAAVPQAAAGRHANGLLKKGLNQRELLNYLNITSRKEPKAGPGGSSRKDFLSGAASIKREHGREEENVYTKVYHRDGAEAELRKNSLPAAAKYEKSHLRPSAFKPVTPKNFSSMQNLYPSRMDEADHGLSNGLHRAYARAPKTVSTSSSSSSPSRHGGPNPARNKALLLRGHSQDEENLSDSGHNSINSLPLHRPPFRPHLANISASMGHINTISSLDRAVPGSKVTGVGGVAMGENAPGCCSMASLSRLGPAPYDLTLSLSMEEVVRDLEERLVEKELELKQMRKNLDESEGAIAQVFEGKQRLWEQQVEELKVLYAAKLRQVWSHAQRAQRSLQLQLIQAQQEGGRRQAELDALRREWSQGAGGGGGASAARGSGSSPTLEEARWEVCQKAGEVSLLKQQLRDSQAEATHKLSQVFLLKTQLREARAQVRSRDRRIDALELALQGAPPPPLCHRAAAQEDGRGGGGGGGKEGSATGGCAAGAGATEWRLRAELLLERRQSEAQATAFQEERLTWQTEKDKVLRYQQELQASYLEVVHRNDALETQLQELRAARGGGERGEGEGEGGRERSGTLDRELHGSWTGRGGGGGGGEAEDTPPSGLPWIERVESSEI